MKVVRAAGAGAMTEGIAEIAVRGGMIGVRVAMIEAEVGRRGGMIEVRVATIEGREETDRVRD